MNRSRERRNKNTNKSHKRWYVYLEKVLGGLEREEHPDLPTDTVPPDSPPLILRTYIGGSTGELVT